MKIIHVIIMFIYLNHPNAVHAIQYYAVRSHTLDRVYCMQFMAYNSIVEVLRFCDFEMTS